MSARYYVSTDGAGRWQLTTLGADETDSYPLPCMVPGLVEQLDEWRRWRDALSAGLSVATDSNNRLAAVFADLLGSSLQSGEPESGEGVMSDEVIRAAMEAQDELGPTDWDRLGLTSQGQQEVGVHTALAAAVPLLLAPLRKMHRPVEFVFSWRGGLRRYDPCPDCKGKAGVHGCGCWQDEDCEYECLQCSRLDGGKGVRVAYPCPTVQELDRIVAEYSGEGEA